MAERIWDKYITERDRVLAERSQKALHNMGKRPALVLVDIYRRVFGDRPQPILEAIKTWPSSCGEAAWEALPKQARLLQFFRDEGLPVAHVTGLPDVKNWRTPRGPDARKELSKDEMTKGFEIMPEVAPLDTEPVFRKAAPSSFFGTSLLPHLLEERVDHIVVIGESTSGCIRATAVDGRSFRFGVTVVEDCVFDRTESAHAINLFDMNQKYADVLSLEETIEQLKQVTGSGG